MRLLGVLLLAIVAFPLVGSGLAEAKTLSVTQTVTITAYVAPARSIMVDNKGGIVKIVSNTNEPIAPKVFLNEKPSEELPLTPALLQQYESVIYQRTDLNGIEIPVQKPLADPVAVKYLLLGSATNTSRTFIKV